MFLSENTYANNYYGANYDVPEDFTTFALQESEEYHQTVESMIIAEHTAIINEDSNLLAEAAGGFFSKIGEIFKKFIAWVKKVVGKFTTWIKALFADNQKLANMYNSYKGTKVEVKLSKVNTKIAAQLRTGDMFGVVQNDYKKGADVIQRLVYSLEKTKSIAASTKGNFSSDNSPTDDEKKEIGAAADIYVASAKEYAKNVWGSEDFATNFHSEWTDKYLGTETDNDVTFSVSDINVAANFLKKVDKSISNAKKAQDTLIKAYTKAASAADKLSAEVNKEGKEARRASVLTTIAGRCRSIASLLNQEISECINATKKMISVARTLVRRSMTGKVKKDGKNTAINVDESANILSQFSPSI